MAKTRPFDIVLLGATGFTGKLVAHYLNQNAPKSIKWAIAGRNMAKLEALLEELTAKNRPQCLAADSHDQKSLDALAAQTRVVATTVGPYIRHGEGLAKACATQGTDYLDITGEPAFLARITEKYDAIARENGAALISCCGFDSIPADLGTLYAVSQLPESANKTVRAYVKSNGNMSGGTWASALEGFSMLGAMGSSGGSGASDKETRLKLRIHPYPLGEGWAIPLPLIDTQIVRKSAKGVAQYGPSFQFGHYLYCKTLSQVASMLLSVGAVVGLAQIPAIRRRMAALLPQGEGPSEAKRAKTYFKLIFVAQNVDQRVVTQVSGGDPGYTETSKMLAEAALEMAENRPEGVAGVCTPAQALGHRLIQRLDRAGIRFEVLSSTPLP